MAIGRRCAIGCESWPDEPIFVKCPICGETTKRCRGLTPLPNDEAQSILLHSEFETYYVRYCAKRGQPVEGPLPDLEPA